MRKYKVPAFPFVVRFLCHSEAQKHCSVCQRHGYHQYASARTADAAATKARRLAATPRHALNGDIRDAHDNMAVWTLDLMTGTVTPFLCLPTPNNIPSFLD